MNFWPSYGKFVRSYKESALSQFKAFKTCLELSNPDTCSTREIWTA